MVDREIRRIAGQQAFSCRQPTRRTGGLGITDLRYAQHARR
jgi:hypothetical protein